MRRPCAHPGGTEGAQTPDAALDAGAPIDQPARMFPIRDHNPSGRVPFVTRALVVLNVLIFLAYWFGLPNEMALDRFYFDWGLVPARVMQGGDWGAVLTSMFLHGGWAHLFGNMLFLWIFGDNLEDQFGPMGFLLFYLACGAGAALAQIAADPGSGIPMVGASGAIAGVMGGYLLLYPRARVDVLFFFLIFFRIFPIPAWAVLGFWFGSQVVAGLATPIDLGGVAYWAHVGGFVAGLLLVVPLWLRHGAWRFWRRTAGHPDHPAVVYGKSRIPLVRR